MSGIKPKNSVQKKSTIVESRLKVVKNQLVYYREITETIREPFIILTRDLHVVTANLAFYRMFKVRKKTQKVDTYTNWAKISGIFWSCANS